MDYDSSIDIWSYGCVLAEAYLGSPIFKGDTTVDQLLNIFKVLGVPDTDQMSYLNRNKTLNNNFPHVNPVTINKVFQGKGKELTSVLNKIFLYEPHKRLTALEIMALPFFDELRQKDSGNGKFIIPQLFDFSESELSLYTSPSQIKTLKKVIPEWADCYKLLQ